MNKNIITDQKEFFNKIALHEHPIIQNKLFYDYVNKEQVDGFKWISNCKSILDYGCGAGTSLDLFFKNRKIADYNVYGVDIANEAIKISKKKYSTIKFYVISDNKIPQIKNSSLDGAYMFHVLHHSHNHQSIFSEIGAKLKPGGKFLVNDLTSHNPIIKIGRILFTLMPNFIKNKFSDDLLVEGKIPEKYQIDINLIIKQLRQSGFVIEGVGYGHLFFFGFNWIDRFIHISRLTTIRNMLERLIQFEEWMLRHNIFKKFAEVVYIKCIKKNL